MRGRSLSSRSGPKTLGCTVIPLTRWDVPFPENVSSNFGKIIFGGSYFFNALIAKIDTHIRSYLNPSIMKVN